MTKKIVWKDYQVTWTDWQNQTHKTAISLVCHRTNYVKSLTFKSINKIRVKTVIDIKPIKRR